MITDLYNSLTGTSYSGSLRGVDLSRRNTAASSSSFGEQVAQATPGRRTVDVGPNHKMIIQDPISVRLPGKNCLYSGGDGLGQSAYIEYMDYSTEDDPVVRITGNSLSGEYDQIVHINNIDPSNATYPELYALIGHLQKSGQYKPGQTVWGAVPLDVECGDYSQRQNFIQKIQYCVMQNQRYNTGMAQTGMEFLTLYEKFIAKQTNNVNSVADHVDILLDSIGRARVECNL